MCRLHEPIRHPKASILNAFEFQHVFISQPVENYATIFKDRPNQTFVQNYHYIGMCAPREPVIFTDGSRMDGKTGFDVFHGENFEMGFRLVEPSGVFTAELTDIFYALEHIRNHSPVRYLILTDSLSSVQALQTRAISPKGHPLQGSVLASIQRILRYQYRMGPISCRSGR
jgi:hypothetical protein